MGRLGYSICIKVNCISGDCCFESEQEARTVVMFLLLPTKGFSKQFILPLANLNFNKIAIFLESQSGPSTYIKISSGFWSRALQQPLQFCSSCHICGLFTLCQERLIGQLDLTRLAWVRVKRGSGMAEAEQRVKRGIEGKTRKSGTKGKTRNRG